MPRGKYVRTAEIKQRQRESRLRYLAQNPDHDFSQRLGGLTPERCREVMGLSYGDLEPRDLSLTERDPDPQTEDVLRQARIGGHVIYGEGD